jgi:hypothetical protein
VTALAVLTELQPVEHLAVVIELRPRRRRIRRVVAEYVCERCGATFGAKQRRASFCSSACRQAAYRARRSTGEPPAPSGLTLEELLARNEHVRRAEDLEAILRGSERDGVVERIGDLWRLTETARREYGAAFRDLGMGL